MLCMNLSSNDIHLYPGSHCNNLIEILEKNRIIITKEEEIKPLRIVAK